MIIKSSDINLRVLINHIVNKYYTINTSVYASIYFRVVFNL